MSQFVGVRMVKANAMDLSLFQFDYDMTFAVFSMNADKTLYGRFGSRSDQKEADRDISLAGFREAPEGALALHKGYPANKAALAGKGPRPVAQKTPEDFPELKRYGKSIDYDGKLLQSCMHCHQIHDAMRTHARGAPGTFPEKLLYPYPMPNAVGLVMNPQKKATVLRVLPGSPAQKAGFRTGDMLETLEGQPLLSTADIQWVLHNTDERAALKAEVKRGARTQALTLNLSAGWRRTNPMMWRESSWQLNRMIMGGLRMQQLSVQEKARLRLPADKMALKLTMVGYWGPFQAAKRAGLRKNDVVLTVDGQTNFRDAQDWVNYGLKHWPKGKRVSIEVLRGGKRMSFGMPVE